MLDHLIENVIGKYTQWEQTYGDVMSTCWLKVNSYVPTQHKVLPRPHHHPRDQQTPRKVGYAHASTSC